MRSQVVERLLGPRVGREIADERLRQRDVLIVIPQLAQGAQVEEPRLAAARCLVEVGLQGVARRIVSF